MDELEGRTPARDAPQEQTDDPAFMQGDRFVRQNDRSAAIAARQAEYRRLRDFRGHLVEPRLHAANQQRWRDEQAAERALEELKAAYTWRGILRRIGRRIADWIAGALPRRNDPPDDEEYRRWKRHDAGVPNPRFDECGMCPDNGRKE